MADFLIFMHDDAPGDANAWANYFKRLRAAGRFQGGSAIGAGACFRKDNKAPAITPRLSGYIRVSAENLEEAKTLLAGNPVYEAGGTIEVRELPES